MGDTRVDKTREGDLPLIPAGESLMKPAPVIASDIHTVTIAWLGGSTFAPK